MARQKLGTAAIGVLFVSAFMSASFAASETLPPLIKATVLPGGWVQIDGEQFRVPVKLRAKLDALRKKNGASDIDLDSPGCQGEDFTHAVRLLRNAGGGIIACLVPPRNVP